MKRVVPVLVPVWLILLTGFVLVVDVLIEEDVSVGISFVEAFVMPITIATSRRFGVSRRMDDDNDDDDDDVMCRHGKKTMGSDIDDDDDDDDADADIKRGEEGFRKRKKGSTILENNNNNSNKKKKKKKRKKKDRINVINDPNDDVPIVQTIAGGTAMIFEMARRMLIWDDMTGVSSSSSSSSSSSYSSSDGTSLSSSLSKQQQQQQQQRRIRNKRRMGSSSSSGDRSAVPKVLPRWHPHAGISDVNPSFRTKPPIMNNQGFARTIWRNVRKRNKPSLWRHALRTYERMASMERDAIAASATMTASQSSTTKTDSNSPLSTSTTGSSLGADGGGVASGNKKGGRAMKTAARLRIQRSNVHFEGALVACAKLGLWQEALRIYREVESIAAFGRGGGNDERNHPHGSGHQKGIPPKNKQTKNNPSFSKSAMSDPAKIKRASGSASSDAIAFQPSSASSNRNNSTTTAAATTTTATTTTTTTSSRRSRVYITDDMVMSLIKACVRGSKKMSRTEVSLEDRRAPLDELRCILAELEGTHQILLVANHLNPLAAAYQSLGLLAESSTLLQRNLHDRITGPEADAGDTDPLNVHDFRAKDKGSYALLVKSAVTTQDWEAAIEALRDMTEAGLYPNPRHLNSWNEVAERKTKPRTARSWKKKRDEYWLDSVRL